TKKYDESIAVATKWVEKSAGSRLKKVLGDSIREKAFLQQGVTSQIASDFSKYRDLKGFEQSLNESIKWDEGNLETLQALANLNTYFYNLKKDNIFKSKIEIYSTKIDKIIAQNPNLARPSPARMISSVENPK
ncbi:MAG: hypothetical protein ACXVAX_10675, partial [Pseudobdellovibrio sp.]